MAHRLLYRRVNKCVERHRQFLSEPRGEDVTGEWRYPPTAKLDRLLRHVRVPIGLLTNRDELRLVYAPHGESTGHVTFRLRELSEVGGRPMLDALVRSQFALPVTIEGLLESSICESCLTSLPIEDAEAVVAVRNLVPICVFRTMLGQLFQNGDTLAVLLRSEEHTSELQSH